MIIIQGRDYQHTRAFEHLGTDSGLRYQAGDAVAIGRHVLSGADFDAAEFSLSAAMIMADRGTLHAVPIPVFPARAYFHSYLFVRQDSPLDSFESLAGRRIGLRDFGSTGAIWFRGLLADRGMNWRDIDWITGPSAKFAPPPGARVSPVSGDLEQMLIDGEIDMFFSAKVKDAALRPLLRDGPAQEAAYGMFPIIHTVVLSKALVQERPDAARLVFNAYVAAQALGNGPDPMPYGLGTGNRHIIATFGRHLAEQGLIKNAPDIDTMFHPDGDLWHVG